MFNRLAAALDGLLQAQTVETDICGLLGQCLEPHVNMDRAVLFKVSVGLGVAQLCSPPLQLQPANPAPMGPDGRRTNATPPAIRISESLPAASPPPLRGRRSLAALNLHYTPADESEY